MRADLPGIGADELAHSARLVERIRLEIEKQHGWIGFARYMQLALYEPGLGYYSAGARKFGAEGDFVTAPEVAPVFSRCIATQCAEVLAALGGGDLLELGAGSGAMAAELLRELERCAALPGRYAILELSADLRERQHAALRQLPPELSGRVEWLERLPERWHGVIVANEVLDALPVERFAIRDGAVFAVGVGWQFGALELVERPAPPPLEAAVRALEAELGRCLPDGYCSELNLGLDGWMAAVAAALTQGLLLFVDYGLPRREYYAAQRSMGTLLCHFRQRFHDDALWHPGLQDIGAWVDFTAVAAAGVAAGLSLEGYTTQSNFLLGCGLARQLGDAERLGDVERLNLSRQVMLLTLPGEMGERFKVIALGRGNVVPWRGFALRDLRHTL